MSGVHLEKGDFCGTLPDRRRKELKVLVGVDSC